MDFLKEFHGPNAGYIYDLYERYQQDPNSVDAETRRQFERWQPPVDGAAAGAQDGGLAGAAAAAVNLANAIRTYGHLSAHLDPLGSEPPGDPWQTEKYHHVSDADLQRLPGSIIGGPLGEQAANALEAIELLRVVYTRGVGYEYSHIQVPEEREWLRSAAECGTYRTPNDPFDPVALLKRLTEVETFEHFIHRSFPGKTRFSIEGLDMLVPMLDELLGCSAEDDLCMVMLGMAHRGRLNVLAHILGKPYEHFLAEFKDPLGDFPTRDELGWTGDVKYHKGARRALAGGEEVKLVIYMAPNPSHLEHINPVITGMARAAGTKADQPGEPLFFPAASLPVLIHGDASFTGQGIVAETMNLSRLPGYAVGGTIHIIANNQLGYTTLPSSGRSTLYASDPAKGFEIPIIHVNADDPVGSIEAVRTAFAYRQKFQKDFLIDLIGYRRYGHNEGDEPGFTQPQMYKAIEAHPTVRQIWAQKLVTEGKVEPEAADQWVQDRMHALQDLLEKLDVQTVDLEKPLEPPPRGAARQVDTAVDLSALRDLNNALLGLPEGFHPNRKLQRGMKRRQAALENPHEPSIDWATAEELALASILADGTPIRFTGEDVERGTFSHRHAVFHDVETGARHIPLQALPQAKASFEVWNSPLSENATIGFEFGFDIIARPSMVIWEAQYGDFINTAQAIIDQFVVSSRAKWEQTPSLVLLLPHGMEGQGPDHSTGRAERFLEMAADTNLRMANCTTAAQYFHLLRRHAALLKIDPLPLVVLTPKSLLRHPQVASMPVELEQGRWQPVIDDPLNEQRRERACRLILCSGKIYVDLISDERRAAREDIVIVRLEQLYPFHDEPLRKVLDQYPNIEEVLWVQEEPQNMGAWSFLAPRLTQVLGGALPLQYVGRPRSASPAEGSTARHAVRQKAIIDQAYAE
jgi:2-oxoglutarate dehydrogenase E1 component